MMNESANEMNNGMFDLTNAMPHCPVILVLDTSHSMWGQGLADMMSSLKAFYKTIADVQFLNAQVDIAAVSMGDNLCMLEEFTPLHSSDLPNRSIRPKGDTPIGAALALVQEALQAQIRRYETAGTWQKCSGSSFNSFSYTSASCGAFFFRTCGADASKNT